jgi:hypothetical protein
MLAETGTNFVEDKVGSQKRSGNDREENPKSPERES